MKHGSESLEGLKQIHGQTRALTGADDEKARLDSSRRALSILRYRFRQPILLRRRRSSPTPPSPSKPVASKETVTGSGVT